MHLRGSCRLALASVLVAGLVASCGDGGQAPRADGAASADRPVLPVDTQPARPDTPPLVTDTPPWSDAGAGDREDVDPGAGASADAGNADASRPASTDAGEPDAASLFPVLPDASASAGPDLPPPPPVSIVVLPDTQYYSAAYPEVYSQQTRWILDQLAPRHIQAVLHVGDLVDGFNDLGQWSVASTAMRDLDHVVPYVLVPGNHDTDANRQTPINSYFGPASMPWITGTMVKGQIENNYALIDIGPQRWLVVGLEFGPRDAVVAWADTVLKAYPIYPAILLTHAYLYGDGNRYDINLSNQSHQAFIPQDYDYTPAEGINDGEMMWQKLVLPNPNVRMVFSGHDSGAARLSSSRPDGSVVHQMLSDYQWYDGIYFGYGYLRVLELDYGKKTISVQTYSPHLQAYLTDDANQFTLPWNL